MFVYTGKLEWQSEAVNEIFVVVLPNGPVRLGDQIFTFSQWTHDSKGNKKVTWCQQQTIDKVTREDNGDDSFHFGAGWYKYQVVASQGYQTLSIKMYTSGSSSTMNVERMYLSAGDASAGSARLWAGRLNWPQYADNEPILVIVPNGFGTGLPVLAFWQWTTDQHKGSKVNYIQTGTQKADTPAEGSLKFSLDADYSLTCTWDETTEKLAVQMAGGADAHSQDIGQLDLAAHFRPHSHDITPPAFPGEKVELEVFYPQAEQALPRIQSPLPFPPTLTETLAHTAAFVDRAGYLAKYAIDVCPNPSQDIPGGYSMLTASNNCKRYHALDKSYHALLQQVDDLNGQIHDLSNQVVALTGQSDGEKQQIDNLQKKLAETLDDAAKKQAELTDQVQSLQKSLTQEKAHDEEDEKALDVAHQQIKSDQAAQAALQKQVVALQCELAQGALRIQQFQAKISELVQEISNLRGQLAAEKAHNADLQTQAAELKATVAVVQTEVSALKKTLERTAEDLKQALADSSDKDSIIEGLENGMVAIKKDRDAKKTAYEELQKSSSATIQQLEDEIAQLKAGQTAGGGGGNGIWPYPDGWPFPGDSNRGSCWPTPDDLLKQIGGH